MHTCSKCRKSNTECGCKDGPFTTVPGCPCPPDINCPVPQKCVEFIDSACVYLNDYSIVDTGIFEGASMEQIIQMFSLWLTNPSCINPNSSCLAVPHVYPYQITSGSIAIAWKPSITAQSYQVEWKPSNQLSWNLLPAQSPLGPFTAVMSPLLPNTDHYVRVNTFCSAGNCYSVTLRIKTKP